MAADYIKIDRTKQAGNQTVYLAGAIRDIRELADRLADIKDHQNVGGDFTLLEQQFGLQAGAGANFATLLGLVQTALNNANLDEFVGRVAGQ